MIWYFYTFQNDHLSVLLPSITIQRKDIIIIFISHTVHFISVVHLFCNWKFVPLYLPHSFLSSSHLLWQPPVLCVDDCFGLFICFAFYISNISEITQYLSFFVWQCPSNIPLYLYLCISPMSSLFILLLMDT